MNQVLNSTPASPTLAELAAAQQDTSFYASSIGAEQRLLAHLRANYASKLAEQEAFLRFFKGCNPDIVLRAADGRELALRLPEDSLNRVYSAISEGMDKHLNHLEEEIIEELLAQENEAAFVAGLPKPRPIDYRPAILALCLPAASPAGGGVPLMTVQDRPDGALSAAA